LPRAFWRRSSWSGSTWRAMIKVAQAAAADSRLRFATGTAERLPLDEGTFDSSSAPPPSITGRISKRLALAFHRDA
jgi:hypothetical protein